MLRIEVDRVERRLKVITDDSSAKFLLQATREETKYIPWERQWGTIKTTTRLYDEKKVVAKNGVYTFTLGYGWAGYLINIFKPYLSQENYDYIISEVIMCKNYRTLPFPELRDYQNEDVLHLLKYRFGLFACYTSYGKTSVIATLANYAYGLGDSVLIITPGKKAADEIVKRCDTMFNLKVPSDDLRINSVITSGFTNRGDVKDPVKREGVEKLLSSYKWVLVDECEYTINDSGEKLYSMCKGAEYMYAFSGTSDKKSAEMITFVNGINNDVVLRNKDLIKYFGPSLVYRLPLNIKIDNIKIMTRAFEKVDYFDADDEGDNIYNNIMNCIWKTPEICKVIVKLVKKYPLLYIPINNLNSIIEEWIQRYFIGKFRILLICGEGYIYYDLDGGRKKLADLSEACEYVKNGMVDVIPSTSSGYRALDLPGLESIFLIQGLQAGVIIQAIGRCARGKHMNIIGLEPLNGKKIPVYTKGVIERDEMIHTYYKYCTINDITINELTL